MRLSPVPLIAFLLFYTFASFAQDAPSQRGTDERYRLSLKSGSFIPAKNIVDTNINQLNKTATRTGGKSFVILQFENIPTAAEKKQLQQEGIELLDYIPNYAYTATITGSLNSTALKQVKTRAIVELTAAQKMETSLANGVFPNWAVKVAGTIDVWVSFPKTITYAAVSAGIKAKNFDIISTDYKDYHIIGVRLATNRLTELASLPFIEYLQSAPKADEPINNKSTVNTKANVLQSSLPGGRNLTGEGIVVGVGDNADPMRHVDFSGRIINRTSNIGGAHGMHVMGTVGGAGIVREIYQGFAPKSKILVQTFSNILAYAPTYVQNNGMVITNNSYGNVTDDCATFGVYDLYSRIMDQQAFQMPSLQHVFAAGNSGLYTCSPYLPGFSNVLGGYQTAKNTITVGNISESGLISSTSSEGPVRDGRIKPEIVAQGANVMSTYPINTYANDGGTSMAAPAVSGGLALLYQRYKQLHGGINPKNGLMKALLVNGATDKGNTGPDFTYGFGWMNLLRSVKMLEGNNYFSTDVNNGATSLHSITIPAGSSIAQLKVMLYWNDPAAAALAGTALVNDLNLEVADPSAVTHFPQLLNTTPGNVNSPATTGADHVNNIEQVVINNPGAGTYTFSVKGTTIPSGTPQEYFLVYDTIPVSTTLTYPAGGERLQNGDAVYISWDSYGNPANTFTLQYSIDDGVTWTAINTNVAADIRQLAWTIPAVTTGQAKVKIIDNGTGIESISEAFTIVGVPVVSFAPPANQCEGYIAINWNAIAEATDYEIMQLKGDEMVSVATTAATAYTISGLSKDSLYWVSVRARVNGNPGRRAEAISRQPNSGSCTGTISDKDLKIDAIVSPASSGRKFTSTELSAASTITIRIKNLDDVATTGNIPVTYILGTNPPVNETIIAPNIGASQTYDYNFTTLANLLPIGLHELKVSVSYPGDPVVKNDTLLKTFKQLENFPINLTTDFIDDIETATVQSHTTSQTGLEGLDRYDFVSSTAFGQVRTFINSGIANSGNKALTLDADRHNAAGTADSLTATFNLQGYNVATDKVRLDFMYKHHGQENNPANKVWIRGDDQQPWLEAYDLFANQDVTGVFKHAKAIDLSHLLEMNVQNFSSSFQVRWGQWGQLIAADNGSGAGYTFDDIRLYKVSNDIQLISIDTPLVTNCGLNNTVPVEITVRNSVSSVISGIPVKFQVDNNTPVTETIPSINGNTNISYTFTTTADLSASGEHTLKVWVDLPGDSYRGNDTATVILYNSPVVAAFPYLQNFETGDGSWYVSGKTPSWQYGTPASAKLNRAASGSKAWKTNLTGNHNGLEKSYLNSPCFDISGMTNPRLSFSVALDLEDCGAGTCDAAYVEYSVDGKTWSRLGAQGKGTNWYNKNYTNNNVWSIQDYTRWHVATIPLPASTDLLRLRFVLESDPFVNREGIAIDDIHIYDSIYSIYDGPPYTSAISSQAVVNGNNWIDFVTGGKLIASINPNGQNMGSTDVQAYIHTGAVRTNNGQYYHNRNITIKPDVVNLANPATVRVYFLDAETEALINATGCTVCTKPSTAYELGVTKYSHANDAIENGSLADNIGNDYLFIIPDNVTKVPFDKGYYAEFNVKDFSEFWLNNGGLSNDQPLPVELISFTAKKNAANDVITEWKTGSEENTARFEVELAKGNEEYQQNHFVKIGQVSSNGNSTTEQHYQFIDEEKNKWGVRYYRLKMVDHDGRFTYSSIRAVVFDEEIKWQVYPNPSSGIFNLVYQMNEGENVTVKIHDMNGKLVRQLQLPANGFVQKIDIDLTGSQFASGLYLLQVTGGEKKEVFRLLKK